MNDKSSSDYLLERHYVDARDGSPVRVRATWPIREDEYSWTCYVHFNGVEELEVIPVTQIGPFEAIVGAADVIHHNLAPIEEHLIAGDQQGSSNFSRILSGLESKRALERIDAVLLEEPWRKLKKIDPAKIKRKPY